jgi:hypothetical protein
MTTAIPLPSPSASLTAKQAELARARRDIAHFGALAREHPSSARTAMWLDDARAWERRCLTFLRSAGWTEEPA